MTRAKAIATKPYLILSLFVVGGEKEKGRLMFSGRAAEQRCISIVVFCFLRNVDSHTRSSESFLAPAHSSLRMWRVSGPNSW